MKSSKFLILSLFFIILINSCSTQSNILEGKWKVIDWTYISFVGRSLDKEEKEEMNKELNDLILDFKLNQHLSTNKPLKFKFLEDKKFILNDFNEIEIDNQYFPFLIRDEKYFLSLSNLMLQIKKVETYVNSKIKIKKLPIENTTTTYANNTENNIIEDVYLINALDIPPKLKKVKFDDNCLIDCFHNVFD